MFSIKGKVAESKDKVVQMVCNDVGDLFNRFDFLHFDGERMSGYRYMGTVDNCDAVAVFDDGSEKNLLECEVSDEFFKGVTVKHIITQTVVFYNQILNTAVVVSMLNDTPDKKYGRNKLSDILTDVSRGGRSALKHIANGSVVGISAEDFKCALQELNNVVYVFSRASNIEKTFVDLHFCSIHKEVANISDIICGIREKEKSLIFA